MDEDRDIRLDIGTDQAELIMPDIAEACAIREILLRSRRQLGEEGPVQVGCSVFPVQAAEEGHTADEESVLRIIQPSYRAQFQKNPVSLRNDCPVGELEVAVGGVLAEGQQDHFLCAEAVYGLLRPADGDVTTRVA